MQQVEHTCPECGAPVKDGGAWLNLEPRIVYDPPKETT